jgi:GT2 family glycosyltransferase
MPGRLHQGQLLLLLLRHLLLLLRHLLLLLLHHLLLLLLRHLLLLLLRLLLWLWGWLHPKLRKRLRKLSPKRDRKTPIVILRRRRRGPKGSCRGELRLRLRLLLRLRLRASLHRGHGP